MPVSPTLCHMRYLRIPAIVLILLAVAGLFPLTSSACSTFCMKRGDRVVFGKNYDWSVDDGFLMVNKRNVAKQSVTAPEENPAHWVSRYGSVTFNQYGREFPNGGMNDVGLVIELMWLAEARYPEPDGRPTVGCLQWLQYQLDTAATVKDVLASDDLVRIASAIPLHFLVADRQGNVASVEFLDGQMVAHSGDDLPFKALTNSTYDSSLAYLQEMEKEGRQAPEIPNSLDRFARAAARVQVYEDQGAGTARATEPGDDSARESAGVVGAAGAAGEAVTEPAEGVDPVDHAFETLAGLAQGDFTKWSIVYEMDRLRLSFRTLRDPDIRTLSLADVDFDCGGPVMVADLNSGPDGDLAEVLEPYTRDINVKLLEASYSKSPEHVRATTDGIALLAAYPESTSCRN